MNFISEHPYIRMERVVTPLEQTNVEKKCWLKLYEDRVVTETKEFLLNTIIDISFKIIRGQEGFLYLHTNQGVFTYNVKDDPKEFIQCFKEIQKSRGE
ncbi:hypothetical protein [Evansella tamaricis]|uniref:YokE-like PH domain-containing protein n=1 Tax=Evansella tamaricis TaxID=2069301 RepID=A0ABS6JJS6_9BACI|nr:hypothetical protein [Evansella tamaricis]MBU9713793.1 hypothetical protein [Evansella tamaricis]